MFLRMFLPGITLLMALAHATTLSVQAATPSASIQPISDAVWAAMQGKSFHADIKGCAPRKDLVLLVVPYWTYAGEDALGQMIVHKSVGQAVFDIFNTLHKDKSYAFERIELIDKYGGDDHASLIANNTSAYNCRVVAGSTRLSSHAKGLAIDINPVQNPFVTSKVVSPPAGKAWDTPEERAAAAKTPGMILKTSAITKAFKAKGWKWGGTWTSLKDYQHFSKDGK